MTIAAKKIFCSICRTEHFESDNCNFKDTNKLSLTEMIMLKIPIKKEQDINYKIKETKNNSFEEKTEKDFEYLLNNATAFYYVVLEYIKKNLTDYEFQKNLKTQKEILDKFNKKELIGKELEINIDGQNYIVEVKQKKQ